MVVDAEATRAGAEVVAGGLAGSVEASGSILASYAAGAVSADVSGNGSTVKAGGLAGELSNAAASITATYARGSVSANVKSGTATTTASAGGLVGQSDGARVRFSFSNGAVWATGGTVNNLGGLVGNRTGSVSIQASYWDYETSGIATSTGSAGTGKTTSALQTPTNYTGGDRSFSSWRTDIGHISGDDDPWDFGSTSTYPVLKFGAHATIDVDAEDPVAAVLDRTDGEGVDIVVDLTPYATEPVVQGIELLRPGGTLVLAGLKGTHRVAEFDSDAIIRHEANVRGVRGVDRESFVRALRLIASGRYPLERMHTHEFPLEELERAIRTLSGETGEPAISITVEP